MKSIQKEYQKWIDSKLIENGLNVTLTAKQFTQGFCLDDIRLTRNIRYFKNILNTKIYGNAYRRYGKQLKTLFIQEVSIGDRYHIHGIIEKPYICEYELFCYLIEESWKKTWFGYEEVHIEYPSTQQRVEGWKRYIMKNKSKIDFSG